ncbi:MAG: winged helix-turn-helix transcriptional regulator [Ruminococcus sp.]
MSEYGISKLDLKRRNRMQILRVIRENGAISRVDISAFLHITRAAVTIITNEMIAQGILEEVGEEPVDPGAEMRKGRRKILLDINPTYRFALGAYIDRDSVSIGLTTLNAATMDKRTFAIQPDTSVKDIVKMIRSTAKTMLNNSCLTGEHIVGMGIGVMPNMWSEMGLLDRQGQPNFAKLEDMIGKGLDFRVFAGNAIALFALASNRYQDHLGAPLNQVLLYEAEDAYHMAVLYQNNLREEFQKDTQVADTICVNPGGRPCEGYCRGSVKAELSPSAIGEKAAEFYSEEQTPELYRLTEGNGESITLAQILSALDAGDTVLQPLVTELLNQFCLMLNNLEKMFFAGRISMYKFGFTARNLEMIRSHMEQLAGAASAEKLVLCDIEDRHHFLSGCAYAIQNGFFCSGGLDDAYGMDELGTLE